MKNKAKKRFLSDGNTLSITNEYGCGTVLSKELENKILNCLPEQLIYEMMWEDKEAGEEQAREEEQQEEKEKEERERELQERREHKKELGEIPGFLYVLCTGGYYKIGQTGQFERRIKKYISENPNEVKVIINIKVNNPNTLEMDLLNTFASKRHRGEWFNFTDDDIENIRNKLSAHEIKEN